MRRFAALARGVVVCSLVLLVAGVSRSLATPFVSETVDAANFTGYYCSLALDARDRAHLAYYDFTNRDLRYSQRVGNTWVSTTVDATGDVGAFPSIAIDAAGNPHIAYRDFTNGDLKYAYRTGGVWTTEIAYNGTGVAYCSLRLTASGVPCVAFLESGAIDLVYATKATGVWTSEVVDGAATTVGYYCSLALDDAGRPHISYFDNSTDDLRYAFRNAGAWLLELVDATGFASSTSIALDDQGNPRIAYYDSTPGDLRFAAKTAGVWATETVESTGSVGNFCSLEINDAGSPRISYSYGLTDADLRYAIKSGSTWVPETVDALGDTGYYTSLELDSQGNPVIAYFDFSSGDVRLADSAVHLVSPAGGETWPVGALRDVVWSGSGTVSILLSTDGGLTEQTLVESVESGRVTLRVPHVPSRFARLSVRRASPLSASPSDSLLTIESSIALLSFAAAPPSDGASGTELAWASDPGPEDLAGYRVRRATAEGPWTTLVDLTRETRLIDPAGTPGTRYQLAAVNGLGEEYLLGEALAGAAEPLAVWPTPYRGGPLTVSFATTGGWGGGAADASVALYTVEGRLVRTLHRGRETAGRHALTWDGRDAAGAPVSPGVYFVRLDSAGLTRQAKLVVVR